MGWRYHRSNVCVSPLKSRNSELPTNLASIAYKFFVQFVVYTALYCIVALSASAYTLAQMRTEGIVDSQVIAVIALGAFFGLFTVSMTLATARYIFINQTNVDVLKGKSMVHQLAIRVPRDTPPSTEYVLITYPLPKHDANGASNSASPSSTKTSSQPAQLERDQLATRTFAVVKTRMGENPWDLGWYSNWTSIMGNTIWEWVLPLHQSPCVGAENNISFYEMGTLYPALRRRFGLPDLRHSRRRSEMRQRRA
jgi:palmitoyltransferase